MTKFKILITLATLLVSHPVHSWEPSYWFGGGGVLTNYSGDFFTTTTSEAQWPVNLGGTVSGGVSLGLTNSLGLHTQASLLYNRVNIFDISNEAEKRKEGTQLSMTSVDLSPMLKVYINGISPNFYIGLGFNVSYLMKCSKENFDKGTTTDTTGNEVLVNENFIATNCLNPDIQTNQTSLQVPWLLNRLNYGLTAGLGFGYKNDDDLYLSFDCTYIYNLSPTIFKEARFGNLKTQNIVLAVNIGVPI